ncbi:MAG: hypothetical protein H0W89_00130 [Candidatus Levybacteria bacterium]|nr:hypothetical protein [Candidatus Levybacteria bacterium]
MLKNRNVQIAIGVVLLVLVGLGGFLFVANRSAEPVEEEASETLVQTITAEEIGLTLEATPDSKKVMFKIAKAEGIESIEYELVYEADSTAQEQSEGGEPRVQRGITGEADIESGAASFESEELDLGSCSRNVCRYDEGVESVSITLKLIKNDGNIYNVEETLEL